MNTVAQEFYNLFLNLIIGLGIGVVFDYYRFLRSYTRPGWLLTQVADLLFWLLCAVLVFGLYFVLTGGEVRLITILVVPAGMAVYLKFLSRRVRPWLYRGLLLGGKCLRFCLRLLAWGCWLFLLPFRVLKLMLLAIWQFALGCLRLFCLPWVALLRWLRHCLLELLRRHRPPSKPPA